MTKITRTEQGWQDEYGNVLTVTKANRDTLDLERATFLFSTLPGCTNCMDCSNCENCHHCSRCTNSQDLKHSQHCTECVASEYMEHCAYCERCQYCHAAVRLKDCGYCIKSEDSSNCRLCYGLKYSHGQTYVVGQSVHGDQNHQWSEDQIPFIERIHKKVYERVTSRPGLCICRHGIVVRLIVALAG